MENPASGSQPMSYELIWKLGEGCFATVYIGQNTQAQKVVAVKEFKKADEIHQLRINQQELDRRIDSEISIFSELNHINVARYIAHQQVGGRMHLMMSLYQMDLFVLMKSHKHRQRRGQKYSFYHNVINQMLDVLGYLEVNSITHGDIKPENILCDEEDEFYLSDFGHASRKGQTPPEGGTTTFMAPEIWQNRRECRSDVWSLGVLGLYLCNLLPPMIDPGLHLGLWHASLVAEASSAPREIQQMLECQLNLRLHASQIEHADPPEQPERRGAQPRAQQPSDVHPHLSTLRVVAQHQDLRQVPWQQAPSQQGSPQRVHPAGHHPNSSAPRRTQRGTPETSSAPNSTTSQQRTSTRNRNPPAGAQREAGLGHEAASSCELMKALAPGSGQAVPTHATARRRAQRGDVFEQASNPEPRAPQSVPPARTTLPPLPGQQRHPSRPAQQVRERETSAARAARPAQPSQLRGERGSRGSLPPATEQSDDSGARDHQVARPSEGRHIFRPRTRPDRRSAGGSGSS